MTTLLAFLVLLGVLITVHELGHFLVAKLCGVKVLTFSIGFGPKLLSFTRGDTEYRIAVLPLGGFVRMYGDDITAEVPESERHVAYLEKSYLQKMAIAAAGPIANLLLAFAVFFALGVGTETVADPVVGTVLAGEPADVAGIRAGDRIVAIEGQPITQFSEVVAAISPRASQPTALTIQRPGTTAPLAVTVTPSASPSGNPADAAPVGRLGLLTVKALPLVAVAAGSAAEKAGVKYSDRVIKVDGVPVATRDELYASLDAVKPEAPVALTIERTDDKAVVTRHDITIAGVPAPVVAPVVDDAAVVDGAEAVAPAAVAVVEARPAVAALSFAVVDTEITGELAERRRATEDVVVAAVRAQRQRRGLSSAESTIASLEPDSPASARLLEARGHRVVAVDGKPLGFASDMTTALTKDPDGIHVVGLVDKAGNGVAFTLRLQPIKAGDAKSRKIFGAILTSTMGEPVTSTRDVGVVDAIKRAFVATGETIKGVAGGYVMLFSGQVGLDELGGTVMLANIAGDAARAGIAVFAGMLAVISVNLAVLNLLPVPVLDGGHMLLFTIEAVRRKRLSVDARIKATWIGLIFVGALMIVANGNDLYKLITGS